ncbi:MAG: TetR/AcrR family transcriptional regulator [Bacteroidales bacterium]
MDNRERIIEGAADLFRVYGIKSVTMDSLASHLGMSKRTIYEIFADKDELLLGVLSSMAEKQKLLVIKVLDESGNAIEAIFRLLEISRDHMQSMSPAFQADLKKFHHEVLMKKTDKCEMPDFSSHVEVIRKGISQGLFRDDLNPDIVNRAMYAFGRYAMDNELFPYEQFTRREIIRNVFINYMRGISTPKGLKLINELETRF